MKLDRLRRIRPRATSRAVVAEARIQAAAVSADRELRRAAQRPGKLLVGPWLSEVGFEILYWIPLLNWLADRYGLEPERLVALTRGGAGSWYADLCGSTVDVFEFYAPEEIKAWHTRQLAETRSQKQMTLGSLDREILERVRQRLGEEPGAVLHPSLMYNLLRAFWARRRPITFVERHTAFKPLPHARLAGRTAAALEGLPDEYVAVKAYFSSCFPDSEANRAWLTDLLGWLSRAGLVVLLSTGLDLDDHPDYSDSRDGNVITLEEHMTATDNLVVQTRVIQGARALFATYGGFSYLGPFLGVTSYSFYSEANFNPTHLDVMARAARALNGAGVDGGFVAFDVREARLLERLNAGAALSPSRG